MNGQSSAWLDDAGEKLSSMMNLIRNDPAHICISPGDTDKFRHEKKRHTKQTTRNRLLD
jgi:plastocyanin